MAYAGYLIKLNGSTILPHAYIRPKSYRVTPAQRTDVDSGVTTANGVLHRTVLSHTRSKIEFETRRLPDAEVAALISLITANYSDELERKINLSYYVPGAQTYASGTFYMPDIQYPIDYAPGSTLIYEPIRIAFIEY